MPKSQLYINVNIDDVTFNVKIKSISLSLLAQQEAMLTPRPLRLTVIQINRIKLNNLADQHVSISVWWSMLMSSVFQAWLEVSRMSAKRVSVHAKWIIGKVIGTKMRKTAKVRVTRLVLDPYLLKVKLWRSSTGVMCYTKDWCRWQNKLFSVWQMKKCSTKLLSASVYKLLSKYQRLLFGEWLTHRINF